jgi:hypothetical protein
VREKRARVALVAFLMAPVCAGKMDREGAMRGGGLARQRGEGQRMVRGMRQRGPRLALEQRGWVRVE